MTNNDKFRFKAYNLENLILIISNDNFLEDANVERKFIIYSTNSQFSYENELKDFYCYFDKYNNGEKEIDYIIRFKNYKGGNFIIYNSNNTFPLKQFEKGFNLYSYIYNFQLNFISDILEHDILLDITQSSFFKIKNITKNSEKYLPEIKDSILLTKGSKYQFEYNALSEKMNFVIKKREVIEYKINEEPKIFIYYSLPIYLLLDIEEFTNKLVYANFYHEPALKYNYQTANLDTKNIQWDNITFSYKKSNTTKEFIELNLNNFEKRYILIKIEIEDLNFYSVLFFNTPFCTFKTFYEYYRQIDADFIPKITSNEALYLMSSYHYDSLLIIFSNISNIRTFRKKQPKYFIYGYDINYFKFIILQSKTEYKLNQIEFYPMPNKIKANITAKIYTDEFSYHNFFEDSFQRKLYIFDVDKRTTLSIKSE